MGIRIVGSIVVEAYQMWKISWAALRQRYEMLAKNQLLFLLPCLLTSAGIRNGTDFYQHPEIYTKTELLPYGLSVV